MCKHESRQTNCYPSELRETAKQLKEKFGTLDLEMYWGSAKLMHLPGGSSPEVAKRFEELLHNNPELSRKQAYMQAVMELAKEAKE